MRAGPVTGAGQANYAFAPYGKKTFLVDVPLLTCRKTGADPQLLCLW